MIFEFSWSDYEEYKPYILEGKERSREEFEKDCNKALKESFEEYLSNVEFMWAGLPDWMEYAVIKMEDYGYKIIKPMQFGYCGLCIPKTDKYSKHNDGIRDKEYQEEFPEFLDEIKRMIQYNDIFDKELYGDMYKEIEEEESNCDEGENG